MNYAIEAVQKSLERMKKMTREEFLESLRRAGIIDENNQLTEKYRPVEKRINRKPMKPSKLAAKMYRHYETGLPFDRVYTDEEVMSVYNFNKEVINFFGSLRQDMIISSLTQFEDYLASVLALRGRRVA